MSEISAVWANQVAHDRAESERMQQARELAARNRERELRNWQRADDLIDRIGVAVQDDGPVDSPPFDFVRISYPLPLGPLETADDTGRDHVFAKVFTTCDWQSHKEERKGRFIKYEKTVYYPGTPSRSGVMFYAGMPDGSDLLRFAHTLDYGTDIHGILNPEDALDAIEIALNTSDTPES